MKATRQQRQASTVKPMEEETIPMEEETTQATTLSDGTKINPGITGAVIEVKH